MKPCLSARCFMIAAILLQPGIVSSATFDIANGNVTNLSNALLASNTNDEDDTINLARGGSYTLVSPLITTTGFSGLPRIQSDNGHSLTIYGAGATIQRSSAAGTLAFRIFDIASASDVTFEGLSLKNGQAYAVGGSGPQYAEGGAICNRGGTLTIRHCSFTMNTASAGGAVYNIRDNGGGHAHVLNCAFTNNEATGYESPVDGGGAFFNRGTALVVESCTFNNNHAVGNGGALGHYNILDNTFSVIGSAFNANTADRGGALHCYGNSNLALTRSTFSSNSAASRGGAISGYGGNTWNLSDCSFTSNTCPGGAGGAIGLEAASLAATGCTFLDNSAYAGGGIDNYYANTTLTNCTLSGNRGVGGGAINNLSRRGYKAAHLVVTNCTLNLNAATGSGGGINSDSGGGDPALLTIANSIFKKAAAGSNIEHSYAPSMTSLGHNLCDDAAGGDGTTAPGGLLNGSSDIRNTDPMLDPAGLQYNGGQTPTIALQPTSPAINQGGDATAPPRDQRGYLRNETSEIGAFEYAAGLLRLGNMARSGNDVVVSFEVVAGRRYRLERKLSLTDPSWQSLAPDVPDLVATGNDVEVITDPNAFSLGRAFYRVIVVP